MTRSLLTTHGTATHTHQQKQGLFFYRLCEMLGIVMSNQPMIFQELNVASATNSLPTKFEFLDPHLLGTHTRTHTHTPTHTHTHTHAPPLTRTHTRTHTH